MSCIHSQRWIYFNDPIHLLYLASLLMLEVHTRFIPNLYNISVVFLPLRLYTFLGQLQSANQQSRSSFLQLSYNKPPIQGTTISVRFLRRFQFLPHHLSHWIYFIIFGSIIMPKGLKLLLTKFFILGEFNISLNSVK